MICMSNITAACANTMLTSPQTIIATGALSSMIHDATRRIDKFCNSALTLATDMLFPKSKCMYKYQASSRSRQISPHMLGTTMKHPTREGQTGVCTNDASATRCFSSHVAMPGCVNTSTCEAEYTYLSLNFAPEGTRAVFARFRGGRSTDENNRFFPRYTQVNHSRQQI